MNFIKNGRVYDVMPCADSFNDIHEIKCGQAEEKLEAGGDEKLIFNFIWPKLENQFSNRLAGAAEPRRPAAADGRPFGGQRRLSGRPTAALAAAAVSFSATVPSPLFDS